MDRPPQGHSDVLGIITGMTQVSVTLLVANGRALTLWEAVSDTGNLGVLRNYVSKDKNLFSSEVHPLPRVFGSFPFSRETVLQGACLSTGCREGTAREGSECLRNEVWRLV